MKTARPMPTDPPPRATASAERPRPLIDAKPSAGFVNVLRPADVAGRPVPVPQAMPRLTPPHDLPLPMPRRLPTPQPVPTEVARPMLRPLTEAAPQPVTPVRRRDEEEREPVEPVGVAAVAGPAAPSAAPSEVQVAQGPWPVKVPQELAEVIAVKADRHGASEMTLALSALAGGGSVSVTSLGDRRLRLKLATKDAEAKAASLTSALRERGFEVVDLDQST